MAQAVKNLPATQETQVRSLGQKDPLEENPGFSSFLHLLTPTPAFLPGEFHGQRRLAGYSPWSHTKSQT